MRYLEARRALVRLHEFRRLAVLFWALTGIEGTGRVRYEIQRVALNDLPAIEGPRIPEVILQAGQRMQELLPSITTDAMNLGISLEKRIQPGVGDVDVGVVNMLVYRSAEAVDAIDRCIGAADEARHRAMLRLVIPIYWLVDLPALAVRWPWLILERAGLPVEQRRLERAEDPPVPRLRFDCSVVDRQQGQPRPGPRPDPQVS
jgi:hypothetical protein